MEGGTIKSGSRAIWKNGRGGEEFGGKEEACRVKGEGKKSDEIWKKKGKKKG